jgi:hypothetical protein
MPLRPPADAGNGASENSRTQRPVFSDFRGNQQNYRIVTLELKLFQFVRYLVRDIATERRHCPSPGKHNIATMRYDEISGTWRDWTACVPFQTKFCARDTGDTVPTKLAVAEKKRGKNELRLLYLTVVAKRKTGGAKDEKSINGYWSTRAGGFFGCIR